MCITRGGLYTHCPHVNKPPSLIQQHFPTYPQALLLLLYYFMIIIYIYAKI
jgi:hypothetical protein